MKPIKITLQIEPTTASRPKVSRNGGVRYSKSHHAFQKEVGQLLTYTVKTPEIPSREPVFVKTVYHMSIAKSKSQKAKEKMEGQYSMKFDMDNLNKLTYDEVLTGIYIEDDRQIVKSASEKYWTIDNPRIEIEIYPISTSAVIE